MAPDNIDRRLLARFEASVEHERARRELLPATWLNAEAEAAPEPADCLSDLFEDVLARARERVHAQREALRGSDGLDPVV